MHRIILATYLLISLYASSSVAGELTVEVPPAPYSVRSMTLNYGIFEEKGLSNDYQLFGVVKDAIEHTWNTRNEEIEINNGLTFNSQTSTSGELFYREFDISIFIQTKKRLGKLLYIFSFECSIANKKVSRTEFDLIEESQLYSEMKRLAIVSANSCP